MHLLRRPFKKPKVEVKMASFGIRSLNFTKTSTIYLAPALGRSGVADGHLEARGSITSEHKCHKC